MDMEEKNEEKKPDASVAENMTPAGGEPENPPASPKKKFWNNRRFKFGALATVITVGFLAALVLLNVVAGVLLERYPLTIDLTGDQRFALTEDSTRFVQEIKQDVSITVCADEETFKTANEAYRQAYEIIKSYAKYSSHITVSFVDLLKNPTFAQKYPELTLNNYDIVVESGSRNKRLHLSDLFNIESSEYGAQIRSSKAEQAMTGALMFVTDQNPASAVILTGAQNVDVSGYRSLLESNNYSVTEANFLTEEIDPATSFVILPQPAADLTAEQVKKLETFLDNNGSYDKGLVFVASMQEAVQPRLKGFLADWGIEVGAEIIGETDANSMMGNLYFPLNQIADSDTAELLAVQNPMLVAPYSHPVNTLFESSGGGRATKVIAKTSETAVLIPIVPGEDFDPAKQPKASYNTVVEATRYKYDSDNKPHTSWMLAVGSEVMLDQSLLNEGALANGSLMAALTNGLTQRGDTLSIVPVDLQSQTLPITSGQVYFFGGLFVILIPLAIIIAGIVVWLRRRHL